jgi:HEPN domain-containing protein
LDRAGGPGFAGGYGLEAQQAGEKALEGVIRLLGRPPTPSHYLSRLYDALKDEIEVLNVLPPRDAVIFLDQYYIGTRYPDLWGEQVAPGRQYTPVDAERAVAAAERLVGSATRLLAALREGV